MLSVWLQESCASPTAACSPRRECRTRLLDACCCPACLPHATALLLSRHAAHAATATARCCCRALPRMPAAPRVALRPCCCAAGHADAGEETPRSPRRNLQYFYFNIFNNLYFQFQHLSSQFQHFVSQILNVFYKILS